MIFFFLQNMLSLLVYNSNQQSVIASWSHEPAMIVHMSLSSVPSQTDGFMSMIDA